MSLSPPRQPKTSPASDGEIVVQALQNALALRLGGNGQAEILDIVSGNVNCIYKIKYLDRYFGARLAVNQYRLKYEKNIIKENYNYVVKYSASYILWKEWFLKSK